VFKRLRSIRTDCFYVEVLAIKNGKEINRFTGVIDEDQIETILLFIVKMIYKLFVFFRIKIVHLLSVDTLLNIDLEEYNSYNSHRLVMVVLVEDTHSS
jgi:hypothetical protein